MNCEAYSSFEGVSSDHRIISAKIHLGLPRNKTIFERHTLNDKYKNFLAAYIQAVVKCIPTKPRAKCRVSQEAIVIKEKRVNMEKASILGKPPEVSDKPIQKIIDCQLDIKVGQFIEEELGIVLKKIYIKNRKAAGLDEIPAEVWKTSKFDDILL